MNKMAWAISRSLIAEPWWPLAPCTVFTDRGWQLCENEQTPGNRQIPWPPAKNTAELPVGGTSLAPTKYVPALHCTLPKASWFVESGHILNVSLGGHQAICRILNSVDKGQQVQDIPSRVGLFSICVSGSLLEEKGTDVSSTGLEISVTHNGTGPA